MYQLQGTESLANRRNKKRMEVNFSYICKVSFRYFKINISEVKILEKY